MIIWLKKTPPGAYEKRFSYRFCQHLSRQSTGEEIVPVPPETQRKDLPVPSFSSGIDQVLFINDPELVISKTALDIMRKALRQQGAQAAGPVMNFSPFSRQEASLPYRYFDFPTFLEVVDMFAAEKETRASEVEELDPACFLLAGKALNSLPPDSAVSFFLKHLQGKRIVAEGAFVHRYPDYFSADRMDLVELVPENVKRILDLGCAKGGYGRTLKQARPHIFIVGVEQDMEMAELAARYYDLVIQQTVEEAELPGDFDLINMGDVLEHLANPWEMLTVVESHLRPGGYLVGSVPNVGHWTVVRNLLGGRFDYLPIGLLSISHLRFFTKSTLKEILQQAGFQMDDLREDIAPLSPQGQRFIELALRTGLGDERSLRTGEFIFRARKV